MAGRTPLHMLRRRGKQTPVVSRQAAAQRDLRDPITVAKSDVADLKDRSKRLKGSAAKKAKSDIKKAENRLAAAKAVAKVSVADQDAKVKAGVESRKAAAKAKKKVSKAKADKRAAIQGGKPTPTPVLEAVDDDAAEKAEAAMKAAEAKAAEAKAAEAEAKAAEAEAKAAEAEAKAAEAEAAEAEAAEAKAAEAKAAEAKAAEAKAAEAEATMPAVDMGNTRDQLDAAALSVGVVNPDKMAKKQDVFDAIVAAMS